MNAAVLPAALQADANKTAALLLLQANTSRFSQRSHCAGPAATWAGFATNQAPVRPPVMQTPVSCGTTPGKMLSDTSARLLQLVVAIDMLRAVRASTPAPQLQVFPQPAMNAMTQQQHQMVPELAPCVITTSQNIPATGQEPLPRLNHMQHPYVQSPPHSSHASGSDSGISTPAESDGVYIGDTFYSREHILRIYSLRSRYTCGDSLSLVEKTAAGRGAIVAHIHNMPVEHVRRIWNRACASHITELVWAEHAQQRYENKILLSSIRRSLKRKEQGQEQPSTSCKRKHVGVVADEAHGRTGRFTRCRTLGAGEGDSS